MATINVKYDTKTKTLSIDKDGEDMPDVHSVSFDRMYESYDKGDSEAKHQMSVTQRDKSNHKEEGYMTHTHTSASENGDLVTTSEAPPKASLVNFIKKHLERRA